MAICLFKADVLQNRDKILHILDCAGNNRSFYLKSAAALTEVFLGETLAIAELRFRTLMHGKPHLPHLVRSALKLFCIYVNQDLPNFRANVLKVTFEKNT